MDINCKNLPFGRTVSTIVNYIKKNKVETLALYNVHEFIIKGSIKNYVQKYHKLVKQQKSNTKKLLQLKVKSIVRRMLRGMRLNELVKVKLYEDEVTPTLFTEISILKPVKMPILKGFKVGELVSRL